MSVADVYRVWLQEQLDGALLSGAYIFGSALYSAAPRDIDLVVVTLTPAGSTDWFEARRRVKDVASKFLVQFGKPLSVIVATSSEWQELDGTVVAIRLPISL